MPDSHTRRVQRAKVVHDQALAMLASGASRLDVLTKIATAAERAGVPGAVASILYLDEGGLLRNGASPNLPADSRLPSVSRARGACRSSHWVDACSASRSSVRA